MLCVIFCVRDCSVRWGDVGKCCMCSVNESTNECYTEGKRKKNKREEGGRGKEDERVRVKRR